MTFKSSLAKENFRINGKIMVKIHKPNKILGHMDNQFLTYLSYKLIL